MKLNLFVVIFILVSFSSFSQEKATELSDKNSLEKVGFIFGTDVLTGWGGAPNIYAEVHLVEKLGIQIGLGLMPFGYLADFADLSEGFSTTENITKEIEFGTFHNWGGKYLSDFSFGNLVQYFYFDLKRWRYQIANNEGVNYFRNKGGFGAGLMVSKSKKIGFDAHFGLGLGKSWFEEETGERMGATGISGFDMGLTLFYKL